ncbi:hypothetical protein [Clostridium frigidicarnis]|uniref:Uncharacterized protein n=1 Tax=Clostridium frigidicarnis TaxID=84698 RepID=A0A1I1AA26_9CLOT|nr:hypothetical protein [Clostridium frigidicarnis]SFB33358.1 hypothetical protein SAMN04488528_103030 [Clostridium frigidicarnis]
MDENQEVKRGCFLTGILVLELIAGICSIVSLILSKAGFISNPLAGIDYSTGMFTYTIIASIISIISIVLILKWKKVGVYIYVALSLIGFVESFLIAKNIEVIVIVSAVVSVLISLTIAYFSYKVIVKKENYELEE